MGDLIEFPGPEGPLERILYQGTTQITRMRDPHSYLGRLGLECFRLGLIDHWHMPYDRDMVVEGHSLSRSFGFLSPLFQLGVARVLSEPAIAQEEHRAITRLLYQGFAYDGLEIEITNRFGETKIRKLADAMEDFLGEAVTVTTNYSWFGKVKK